MIEQSSSTVARVVCYLQGVIGVLQAAVTLEWHL